jgi:hypothetical protein
MSGRPDLKAEANAAVGRVGTRELLHMESLGVPRRAIARIGARQAPFGLAAIEEHRDGTYTPAEEGPLHIIMPVVEPVIFEAFGLACETIEIVDLVAFRSNSPTKWRWRTGAGWALGADLLDHDAPVTLVAHPLAWLAEAGEALCLLDWSMPHQHWQMLREGPPLVSDDAALRKRLNAAHRAMLPPLVSELEPWKYRKGRLVGAA